MEQVKPNGAYVIIEDPDGRVLIERGSYGYWMLPGGTAERMELLIHAAVDEAMEETGLLLSQRDLRLVAQFVQKVRHQGKTLPLSGVVNLYVTDQYEGELFTEPTNEVVEWRWVTIDEALALYQGEEGKAQIGMRPYMKALAVYDNIRRGILSPGHEAIWSDPVPFRPVTFI